MRFDDIVDIEQLAWRNVSTSRIGGFYKPTPAAPIGSIRRAHRPFVCRRVLAC